MDEIKRYLAEIELAEAAGAEEPCGRRMPAPW